MRDELNPCCYIVGFHLLEGTKVEFNVLVICFSDTSKTYVVLKVQNLKSTTIDRRGREPCWEQDFML